MVMPMSTTTAFDADEDGEHVDQKEYRSMISSLLYLTAMRPDIQFLSVSVHSFSSVSKDFTSASGQEYIQVFASHSRLRPSVLRVFFFGASWFFRRGFCRVSVG
jgi:hypothetical protein